VVILSPTQYLRHSKATENLVAFWSRLPRPQGQACPKRADFSSAKVNGMLPEMFLSEWNGDKNLIIVQSGTVLDRLIGEDITGSNLFDMIPFAFRAAEHRYYEALRDTPCAGMLTRSAPNHQNKHTIYRTIQLPLLDPFGKVCYFVGTGMVLDEAQIVAEGGEIDLNEMQLVERHFFDIGAGLPEPSIVSDDPTSKIYFHSDFNS
jgi:hypothetical protein